MRLQVKHCKEVGGGGEVMEGLRILPPVNNECCFYILLTRPGLPPCIDPPHAISARIQLNGKAGGRSDAALSPARHTPRHVTAWLRDAQTPYSASSTDCRVKAPDSFRASLSSARALNRTQTRQFFLAKIKSRFFPGLFCAHLKPQRLWKL